MGLAADVAHQAAEAVAQEPEFAVVPLELLGVREPGFDYKRGTFGLVRSYYEITEPGL